MKGVGRIYQQTFIDTYSKVAFAKLYDRKTPITAADLLNDRVVPFFEEHGIPLLRILTDRGTEFCGRPERHEYELYLAVEDARARRGGSRRSRRSTPTTSTSRPARRGSRSLPSQASGSSNTPRTSSSSDPQVNSPRPI